MSSIYIQEPPTNGKVLLKTSAGDIDIELWSKETPLACRNFVQLCMEGYYNDVIFHRLVKGFIVEGGDPTGTGMGGESIYGEFFKNELHSRLRFVRRGLVAMSNTGEQDNGSKFFITLDSTPELQNKYTIFGKVGGKTLYNVLTLGEGDVDKNERPIYPHKIISTEILNNPFNDIVPREKAKKKHKRTREEVARSNIKASKNFSLLSFGDEAEEEEEEVTKISNDLKGKSKSSHDLLKDDLKLSSVPVVGIENSEIILGDILSEPSSSHVHKSIIEKDSESRKDRLNTIKQKLQSTKRGHKSLNDTENNGDQEEIDILKDERQEKKRAKIDSAKEEFNKLKAEIFKEKKGRQKSNNDNDNGNEDDTKILTSNDDDAFSEYKLETKVFRERKKNSKKGDDRAMAGLNIIQIFRNKLQNVSTSGENKNDENQEGGDNDIEEEKTMNRPNLKESWMMHKMNCKGDDEIVLARDANIRNEEDWYDIYDSRNAINKRRRNEK